MKCNQPGPGFEPVLPSPFPTMITIITQAYIFRDICYFLSRTSTRTNTFNYLQHIFLTIYIYIYIYIYIGDAFTRRGSNYFLNENYFVQNLNIIKFNMLFISSVNSDFHMTDSLSMVVHSFASRMLMSVSVDGKLLPR